MIDSVSDEASASHDLKKTRRRKPQAQSVDRLPPHSAEAEQGVLGCILLAPNECLAKCIEKLKAGPKTFYDLRHQTIFTAMLELYEKAEGIDTITLQQRLKDRELLESVGGIAYLTTIQDAVPSAANVEYYLDIVLEKYLLRTMVYVCTDCIGRVYDCESEVEEVLDSVERDILRVRREKTKHLHDTKELVQTALGRIEAYHEKKIGTTGIATGYVDLDKMLDGLRPGNLIVIAARTSKGKTSLMMNIAEHVAIVQKIPVGVFSLEMTAEELMLRTLCSQSRVNFHTIRNGFLSQTEFSRITMSAGKIAKAPLYIDDSVGLSIMQLRAKARRLTQEFGIKMVVVDYLQLLHSTSRKADNRVQEIADITAGLKATGKELGVPVLVAAQLNREVERERNRRPRLSDLRESGAIEQDADVVGLLYEPSDKDDDAEANSDRDGIPMNLLIAKQRNGPTGDVPFMFLRCYTRFESAAKVADEDVPPEQTEM